MPTKEEVRELYGEIEGIVESYMSQKGVEPGEELSYGPAEDFDYPVDPVSGSKTDHLQTMMGLSRYLSGQMEEETGEMFYGERREDFDSFIDDRTLGKDHYVQLGNFYHRFAVDEGMEPGFSPESLVLMEKEEARESLLEMLEGLEEKYRLKEI